MIREKAHAAGDKVRLAEIESFKKLGMERCESRASARPPSASTTAKA